jgi:hypothetical protein
MTSLTDLAVASLYISRLLSPGLYGSCIVLKKIKQSNADKKLVDMTRADDSQDDVVQ